MNKLQEPKTQKLILISIIAIVYSVSLMVLFATWSYDDPFITYRYADNIRQGIGFTYNFDERILSTTTPLFALLLTAGGLLFDNLHLLANGIGVLSLVAGGMIIWRIGTAWDNPIVAWTGLLIYPTFPLVISPLSSETPLYLALCLGAYLAYIRKDYRLTAVLAAMATLTRSDGILVPAIIGLDYLIRFLFPVMLADDARLETRKIPWDAAAIFIIILGIWHGFAWMYFGAPFPATLAAKQQQGLMVISQLFAPGIVRVAGWYAGEWQNWILLFFALAGYIYVVFYDRKWWLLVAWPVLYFAAYTYLGVTSYFWYYVPLMPGLVVAAGLGFSGVCQFIQWIMQRNQLGESRQAAAIILGLIGIIGLAQLFQLPRMAAVADKRYGIYRTTGEWLNTNTPHNATVGALEIGIIGYYSQRNMVDFAGLLQPAVANIMARDTTYQDTSRFAIEEYQPDYVVLYAGAFPDVENYLGDVQCETVYFLPGDDYGAQFNLAIYACPW